MDVDIAYNYFPDADYLFFTQTDDSEVYFKCRAYDYEIAIYEDGKAIQFNVDFVCALYGVDYVLVQRDGFVDVIFRSAENDTSG